MNLARSVATAACALGCAIAALSLATDEPSGASENREPEMTQVACTTGMSSTVDSAEHVVVSNEIDPARIVVARPGTVKARVEVTRRVRVRATVTATVGGCPDMMTSSATVTVTETATRAGIVARRWKSTQPTTAQARREAVQSATRWARRSATKLARANALQAVRDKAIDAARAASRDSRDDNAARR